MFLGKSGTGKAQPLDAKVLTPTGWRLMGELAVGDQVVDPVSGGAASIIGVFPQGERDIHRLDFADGASVECDYEHLWKVRSARTHSWEVITFGELEARALAHEAFETPAVSGVAGAPAQTRKVTGSGFSRRAQAQCIALDSEDQLYITDGYVVTHNTMMATQLLINMADQGTRAIMFSLEQKKGQLYERIACQILGRPPEEVEDLILTADPSREDIDAAVRDAAAAELAQVDALFGHKNLFIVDNVPTDTIEAVEMNAERIQEIIAEINMTKFVDGPADVVIIDHLGILKPGPEAPVNVRNDEMQAAGYIMERLFQVSKQADVFMLVLQQLPKDIPAGVPFAKDAGRGGSKQTDYCDLIFGAHRPEQEAGIEPDEKAKRRGHYKLTLLKNRYGAEETAHLMFDTTCLRIVPAARAPMDGLDDIADQPRVEIPGEDGLAAEGSPDIQKLDGPADEMMAGLIEDQPDTISTHELATALSFSSLGLAEEAETPGEGGWEWS
jgi:hypothetical protein